MLFKLLIAFIELIAIFMIFVKFLSFDKNSKVYDERKQKILLEVFSNTLIYLLAIWFILIIFKLIGFKHLDFNVISDYKEVGNIGLTIILLIVNYRFVNKKYSV